jgi:hypothetical protein
VNKQEAQELLPWYVAGTLSPDETRAVQAFVDSGEIAEQDLNEFALFAEVVGEQATTEPAYNSGVLSNVMASLDSTPQEQAEPPLVVKEAQSEEGLLHKIANFIQWSMTPPLAKIAVAGQFALVIALGALVLSQPQTEEGSFETVSGAVATADLTIAVAANTSEQELRSLLQSIDAQIVGGPNSLGMYNIDLADDTATSQVIAELQVNTLIDFAQPAAK